MPMFAGCRRLLVLAIALAAPADAALWSVRETRLLHSSAASYDHVSATAADGSTMVVGADGAVWVFDLDRGSFVERQRIPSPNGDTSFGRGVALDADTLVVGAPTENRAYVFVRSGGVWSQQASLAIPDAAGGDGYGAGVAVDGDTLVVSAPSHDHGSGATGAVYVYARAGALWSLVIELRATDASAGDAFGASIDFEAGTLLVGAPREGLPAQAGAAYVFVGLGIVWEQQAKLVASDRTTHDGFGTAVALQGATALVGAPGSYLEANAPGAAYVFERSGIAWSQQAKLAASDSAITNLFGTSVAFGAGYAVIGVPGSIDASASVYARDGATWTETPKLYATTEANAGDRFGAGAAATGSQVILTATAFLTNNPAGAARVFHLLDETILYGPPRPAPGDFGYAVASDGDTLLVGSRNDGGAAGAAFALVRAGSSWLLQGTLVATNGAANDRLGTSVAIDGEVAAAGAPERDDGGSNAGAVYVFARGGAVWSPLQQLVASDAASGDQLGRAVASSIDTLVAGAPFDDDLGSASGSAYVFVGDAGGFAQQAKLLPADGASNDEFGEDVAVDGDTAVVGARLDDDLGSASGAVYVFVRENDVWTQQAKLLASDGAAGDFFGGAVAIEGEWIAVGASGRPGAYLFERSGSTWLERATLESPPAFDPTFGAAMSIGGDLVAVGDPGAERILVYRREASALVYQERLERRFTDGTLGGSVAVSGATVFGGSPPTRQLSVFDLARCGDGAVEIGEVCDDGNLADGDGCSAACRWDCSDGLDDDGDGLTDFPSDPGCASAAATTESPQCDDELDNDGDGRIDWDGGAASATPDPQCVTRPARNREAASGCGVGAELAAVLAAWWLLRRRL